MKTTLLLPAASALFLTAMPASASFTLETPDEFTAQGDFNGDGHPDLAVLDRGTGLLRVLGSLSGVSFAGAGQWFTALDHADSLSLDKVDATRYGVAIGSSAENRVVLAVPAADAVVDVNFGARSFPGSVLLTGPGAMGAVVPLPQAASFFVSTDLNDPPVPRQLSRFAFLSESGPSSTDSGNVSTGRTAGLRRGNTVPWQNRKALGFVVHHPGAAESAFVLYTGASDPRTTATEASGLPPDALWVQGDFADPAGSSAFLFYQRDTTTFTPRSAVAGDGGVPVFSSAAPCDLGAPVHLLMAVEKDGADQLLALLDGGRRAVLYSYVMGREPSVRQSWNAPAGETFTQAAPLPGGSFLLLTGTGGRSLGWNRYDPDGNSMRRSMAGKFECGSLRRSHATVFYFDQEPFVSSSARLRRLTHQGDWTDIGTTTPAQVLALTDGGAAAGLGSPVAYAPDQSSLRAITNQFTRTATAGQAPISLATLSNTAGVVPASVGFDPPAGLYPPLKATVPAGQNNPGAPRPYQETFTVRLRNAAGSGMVYRLSADEAWQVYRDGIELSDNAVIQAKPAGSTTRIYTAAYTFGTPAAASGNLTLPATEDANGNGLPDAWEAAFAQYDPAADTDGDGQTALQEFRNGTDPRDRFSVTPPPVVVPTPEFPLALQLHTEATAGNTQTLRLTWSTDLWNAQLQSSNDLTTWTPVTHNITIEGTSIVHRTALPGNVAPAPPPRRYYRLLRLETCE